MTYEQMVYSEATIAMPLVAGYAYHKGAWKERKPKEFQKIYKLLKIKKIFQFLTPHFQIVRLDLDS